MEIRTAYDLPEGESIDALTRVGRGTSMGELLRRGQPYLQQTAAATRDGLRGSLLAMLQALLEGWRKFGVGKIYGSGLAMGLGHAVIGPSYVDHLLEPACADGAEWHVVARKHNAVDLRPVGTLSGVIRALECADFAR